MLQRSNCLFYWTLEKVNMKTLVFLSKYDVNDQIDRSGIPYSIYHTLKKHYNVIWVKPEITSRLKLFLLFVERCFWKIIGLGRWKTMIWQTPLICYFHSKSVQKQIENLEFDGIFAIDYVDYAFLNCKKPIFFRTDSVLSGYFDYYAFGVSKMLQKVAYKMQSIANSKITYMFAASKWVAECNRNNEQCVPEAKIKIVKTGANLSFDYIKYTPKKYCLTNVLELLFVGFDLKRKGIDEAIETVQILNEKYKVKACLKIIGGKPEDRILKNKYVKYIRKLDKNNQKEFDLFYNEFASSDLFLFPTKAECHGIVNCEAAAYGLPIFSYQTGGVPDYVIDGVNGRLLPLDARGEDFANIIFESLKKGDMEKYSIESRRLYLEEYNWDVWLGNVSSYIDSVL